MTEEHVANERSAGTPQGPTWVEGATLAGCSEWKLSNGLTLILIEDHSQPTITINNTILVGSRHERRGERGMAHFLEHMLFKGTPSFADIPTVLRERGAKFNGTTWLDRTHYYEVLSAESDNLAFAIQLEAERMSAVEINEGPFTTEREVIRNELLRGENSPSRVLFQRLLGTCFQHHGYGHPTIGLLEDLDAMTHVDLERFYRDYYVPSRAVLVIAGDIDPVQTRQLVAKYFGTLPARSANDQRANELAEPAQDGEREITLRRVSKINEIAVGYRIPPASHADYPALRMLSLILGMRPTGRLYKQLVENGSCADVSSMMLALHDPGMFIVSADIDDSEQVDDVREQLAQIVEADLQDGIQAIELDRAKQELEKRQQFERADSSRLGLALTESIARGDWRLHFAYDSRYETIDLEELKRVCERYFFATNRTTAVLAAGDNARQAETAHAMPKLEKQTASGSIETKAGEPFQPDPAVIADQVQTRMLTETSSLSLLPRQTRGQIVSFLCHLRIGNESVARARSPFLPLLGKWLLKGTTEKDYVSLQDELRRYRSWLSASGFRGGLSFDGQLPREFLGQYLSLFREIVQRPRFSEPEFEILKRATLSSIDQQRTQPASLASNQLKRKLEDYPVDDPRHTPTLEARQQELAQLSAAELQATAESLLGGGFGEVVLIGPDLESANGEAEWDWLANWKPETPNRRICETSQLNQGEHIEIELIGKTNVGYAAGVNLQLKDSHEDFAALVVANYIFGGASLVSRLSREVRGRRGLSYAIHSSIWAHSLDERGRFSITAATNPENRIELIETIQSELTAWIERGVEQQEVDDAVPGILSTRKVERANSRNLCDMIAGNRFGDRDLRFVAEFEQRLKQLTAAEINQAIGKHIDPSRLVVVTAGELSSN